MMSVKKEASKEFNNNRTLLSSISDGTIEARIEDSLKWYILEAVKAKFYFYLFSAVTVVAPICSAILMNLPLPDTYIKIISGVFAGLTSASASVLHMFNFKKNWELYRAQAEEIKFILAENLAYPRGDQKILYRIEKSMQAAEKSWEDTIDQTEHDEE